MGIKLYPPVVENTLPACFRDNKGMVTITIPFSMNRSVSAAEVAGFEIKIKTIQTGTYLYTFSTNDPTSYFIHESGSHVTFTIKDDDNKLKIGQYYKIQLAYISKDDIVGFYSTASTIKYTTKPQIYINAYSDREVNTYSHTFIGYYDQTSGDQTEKAYSYCFNIYDKNNNVIHTSGECVHNSMNDDDSNIGLSCDIFDLYVDLEYNTIYTIQYIVTTINNLTLSSPKYKIAQRETIDPELHAELTASLNFDNGYIALRLNPTTNPPSLDSGSFVVSRASDDSDYLNWEELFKFKFYKSKPIGEIYKDFTFEQGKKYKYSIQQYNDYDLYSKRIYSNVVYGDFEDGFLYDGERQLKIRYNMKMSKITNTVLESKQETIGSQYPYFFRNGTVNYHEFPINGLISYSMDESRLFMSEEDLNLNIKTYRTETASETTDFKDSLGEEITRERIFKKEVAQWLNNGKPKLLRTPTEGNFIVRLMKVSLSPEDKLGRMLHNFSCTAYEVAKYNSKNLRELGLVDVLDKELIIPQWGSIDLSTYNVQSTVTIKHSPLTSLHFDDIFPGTILKLNFKNGTTQEIQIGETGSYHLDSVSLDLQSIGFTPRYRFISKFTEEEIERFAPQEYFILNNGQYQRLTEDDEYNELIQYYQISNEQQTGIMTYSYAIQKNNAFTYVQNVTYKDSLFKQFIGEHDILKELQYFQGVKDIKTELTDIKYLKVSKRPVDRIVSEFSDEKLIDGGDFYYGILNEDKENRSERTSRLETIYPIGLRAYESGVYYINNGGTYTLDNYGEWRPGLTYYLKGQYRTPQYPIGKVAWTQDCYYIDDENGKKIKDPYDRWQPRTTYYEQYRTDKGTIKYSEVKYVTADNDHVFKDGKFYRLATPIPKDTKKYYTIARKFYPEYYTKFYEKPAEQYYILDSSKSGYVEAYVTINEDYVYEPSKYYIHIQNKSEDFPEYHKDVYKISSELEFNVHYIANLQTDDIIEYENKVLKYYKIKEPLPHILHQIGTEWTERDERANYSGELYDFKPIKYKDFYNAGKNYKLNEYAPYIRINGETIYMDSSEEYELRDLNRFGEITELYAGNGVVVDVIYSIKAYEYIVETTKGYLASYNSALNDFNKAMNNLHLETAESPEKYVDLSDVSNPLYSYYYNNTPWNNMASAYRTLLTSVVSAIGG